MKYVPAKGRANATAIDESIHSPTASPAESSPQLQRSTQQGMARDFYAPAEQINVFISSRQANSKVSLLHSDSSPSTYKINPRIRFSRTWNSSQTSSTSRMGAI
jgi:hypothetical protein